MLTLRFRHGCCSQKRERDRKRERKRQREREVEKQRGKKRGGGSLAEPQLQYRSLRLACGPPAPPPVGLRRTRVPHGLWQARASICDTLSRSPVRRPGQGSGPDCKFFPPAVTFCHRELGGRGHWANLDFCTGSAKHDPMTFKWSIWKPIPVSIFYTFVIY